MAKEKKEFIRVLKCGSASGRLIPTTSSKPQLWQDVSGDEKLTGGGRGEDKLHHGILTASGADGGHRGTLAGTVTLRKHEPVCPKDIQLCGEKSKRPQDENPLESAECVGVVVHGFFCDSSCFPLQH